MSDPTPAPTEVILVVPSWVVVILVLILLSCLCVCVFCGKGEGYKRKIYEMMEEAKLDQDELIDDAEDDSDYDEDEYTVQTTPTKNAL